MKFVLCSVAFLVSSWATAAVTPLKWPESVVNKLNTKTVKETFCGEGAGYRVQAGCEYLEKNKINLNQKIKSARIQGRSLFLAAGKREIEIKLTGSPTQFEINNKKIDLKNYPDAESLSQAIMRALPRVAHGGSLWMNAAYADQVQTLDIMNSATLLMTQFQFDDRWCGSAKKFVEACDANLSVTPVKKEWDRITKKMAEGKKLDHNDLRWVEADANEMIFLAAQMKGFVDRLDQRSTQDALKTCPSSNKPALANAQEDVRKCREILDTKIEALKILPAAVNHPDVTYDEVLGWMEYMTARESEGKAPKVQTERAAQ